MKDSSRHALGSALWLALSASAASAQTPPRAPPQELVVVAPKDPKVKGTFPADGARIAGGTVVLKIAFDQPMTPDAWSYSPVNGALFPDCLARPRLLNDRRTFVLLCTIATNGSFAVQVNAAPDFISSAGRAPSPFLVRFTTTDDVTLSLHDALSQAGLSDDDDPIMDVLPATNAVQTPPKPPPE